MKVHVMFCKHGVKINLVCNNHYNIFAAANILSCLLILGCSTCPLVLGVESRDFSQAEKERTACKTEQIHKMTTRYSHSKRQPRTILSDNSCHFVNLLTFESSSFFLSMTKIT